MDRYRHIFSSCKYAFDGADSILEDKDIGICADIASLMTPPSSVTAMQCMQGCPYTNTAFSFELRVGGESVKCDGWQWLPNAVLRRGTAKNVFVETINIKKEDVRYGTILTMHLVIVLHF